LRRADPRARARGEAVELNAPEGRAAEIGWQIPCDCSYSIIR
jgi:hypothetical protein